MLGEPENWLSNNNLVEQEKKRQEIIFRTNNRMYKEKNIRADNIKTISLLGIDVDENVKWKHHILKLKKKLNISLFGISRIAKICNRDTALATYHAIFHSVLTYGIVLWGGSIEIRQILITQKKAVRYITHSPKNQSCRDLFKILNILTALSTYILEVLKRVKANLTAFEIKSDNHLHFTRQKNVLQATQAKLSTSQKGINFMGPKLFNKLPQRIKD